MSTRLRGSSAALLVMRVRTFHARMDVGACVGTGTPGR
jgi:hypothetical protein